MSDNPKDRRDRQIMIRLNDAEYALLTRVASAADRKVADMGRVAMMRGLSSTAVVGVPITRPAAAPVGSLLKSPKPQKARK
jgi:hypothetical protein